MITKPRTTLSFDAADLELLIDLLSDADVINQDDYPTLAYNISRFHDALKRLKAKTVPEAA